MKSYLLIHFAGKVKSIFLYFNPKLIRMYLFKKADWLMKKLLLSLLIIFVVNTLTGQNVGIGTNSPSPYAILDVKDNAKGILIPRMDSVSRKNIPATKGMLVYDTTTSGFWYNDGTTWVNMPARGNAAGDMLYWDGSKWTNLPAGTPGQFLTLAAGTLLPVWTGGAAPVLTTTAFSSITQSTATSGGNIVSNGGAAITARGVVWDTLTDPTIALATKTVNGSGNGSFTSNLTGLVAGKTYYVRAYATNTNGTTYGNQLNFVTPPAAFTIGQLYGGGIVFYVDGTGQHGLIAATSDQSIGLKWYNASFIATNAAGLAIGTGAANTTSIINIQGNALYAATLCRQFYNGGGFSDWYLPSLFELNELFLRKAVIGGFANNSYWSSSEFDNSYAWYINFGAVGPNQSYTSKSSGNYVRAIRSF
jgi:Protein of unknown function (DUF1566)